MNEQEFQPYEMINDETLEPATIANKILAYRDWWEKKEAKQKQVDTLLEEAGHKPFFGRSGDDGLNCSTPLETDAFRIFCAMIAGESALESQRAYDLVHTAKAAITAAHAFARVQKGVVIKDKNVIFTHPRNIEKLGTAAIEKMTFNELMDQLEKLDREIKTNVY